MGRGRLSPTQSPARVDHGAIHSLLGPGAWCRPRRRPKAAGLFGGEGTSASSRSSRDYAFQKRSVYGANHKSKGLPTGFRYYISLLESARMTTEDPGQLAAAVGASRARTRFAVSC